MIINDLMSKLWRRFSEHLGAQSGVILMNLTRMRAFQWTTHIQPITERYARKLHLFDQNIINIILSNNTGIATNNELPHLSGQRATVFVLHGSCLKFKRDGLLF
jgi:hypothetical protein